MLVLNLPFKALMFLTLMRPSLVLFLVLWLKLVKDFLKVRCRLALLPFLISCLIWLDLVASLPLIKERILVIILLLHFLSLMLGSVLVLMLPLLVWLTPDLRIKKSLLKCNWTIRKRLPRCKMRLKKRLLAFSRRLHARIRKTRYMHKMRCLLINRRSLLLALRLLWKTNIMVTLHEVITFLVSMQISISSLQTHNVNRCGRSRHLARKLSLRRKRSSPNVFEMAATETITSIILIKLIRVSLGTVRHPRRFRIHVIDVRIILKQRLRYFSGISGNRSKKSDMVNINSCVNSRERSGINTTLHWLTPLFTINVTMRDIKSKNVYSRVNSKATTQWRKTESANGVHLEGVASDNRSR